MVIKRRWRWDAAAGRNHMTKSLLIAVVLVTAVSPAWGQRIISRERTIQITVQPGREFRVRSYTSWNRDCAAQPAPQIAVLHPPAHGTVTIRPGESTVSEIREGASDCTGHTYQGTVVWYMPAPGYHGPDQFDYTVINLRSTAHDTIVADVR